MIVLATDFGLDGPYVGQMKAVLLREAPGVPLVDLFADLPPFRPDLAAYLLAAFADVFPTGTVFLCVVDPGVGSERGGAVLEAGGRRFVGPDNGLLAIAARRDPQARTFRLPPVDADASATFHGRDVFAPVAAALARGQPASGRPAPLAVGSDLPDDLASIVYVDRYGNAMTGLRAAGLDAGAELEASGRRLVRRRTFADVAPGEAFWYANANGLAEIAVNQGRACDVLGLAPGDPVVVRPG